MTQNLIPLAHPADTTATVTSIELLKIVNEERAKAGESVVRHNVFLSRCKDELDGEPYKIFVESAKGQTPAFEAIEMTQDQCKLVAMRESKSVRRHVLARLKELEAKTAQTQPPVALPDFTNPAIAARAWAEQFEAKAQAQEQLAIAAPKAQALDRIAQADGEMCITNAAKTIGVQPKKLFEWMERHDWIYRRPGSKRHTAYQARIKAGYLTHKVTTVERSDGSEKVVESVIVTPKGLAKLAEVAA